MRRVPFLLCVALASVACTSSAEAPKPTAESGTPRVEQPPPAPTEPTPEAPKAKTCMNDGGKKFEIGSGNNILDEARSAGVPAPDFFEGYAAETIDPSKHVAVEVTKAYAVKGQALLWYDAGKTKVVVDAAVFPDGLKVADATRMKPGEEVSVGKIDPAAAKALGIQDLTLFLMHARAIGTWIHIGSELCPVASSDEGEGMRQTWSGTHEYYTNEENHDPVDFTLVVTADGTMTVRGEAPS